jgi:5'-methylthioadenosine phosphorylase
MLPAERACSCGSALENAIITDKAMIPVETRRRLDLLLGRHLA